MDKHFFVSICIPSYNRPLELRRLLESIDTKRSSEVQIVICEDKAPKRLEVRNVVETFTKQTNYNIKYYENPENFGHGKNLRECIKQAEGEYVIFMGDDDFFIPEAFDKYLAFLTEHKDCGYILRSSRARYENGSVQYFKYYSSNLVFEPSVKTYVELFGKSVFMSGFTIKTEYVRSIKIEELDSTLLFQLYLMAVVCMKYPSAYCNIPFIEQIGDGVSFFGVNECEQELYLPGKKVTNNINFIKGFFIISKYIDDEYKIESTELIRKYLSKYSYPLMSYSRGIGIKAFKQHCQELKRMELDCTAYFYIYYFALLVFGEKFCDTIIRLIKKIIGRRLNL